VESGGQRIVTVGVSSKTITRDASSALIAGQRIARQCARNAAHGTSSSVRSVVPLFESRTMTPGPARPTSTQFFPGLQRLDRSQIRVSRTSAAMVVPSQMTLWTLE
jgi:hypothetical protein